MKNRNERIIKKFRQGKTQTALAEEFGMTKENIRLILYKNLGKDKAKIISKKNIRAEFLKNPNRRKEIIYRCKNCHKVFPEKYVKRTFCSRECYYEYLKKVSFSPEERTERLKKRMSDYYYAKKKIK